MTPAPLRVVVFSGHRIDVPERETPRFPPECEGAARRAIAAAVGKLRDASDADLLGLAGAASGGDILFHEACEALGVPSDVMLALPADEYEAASVADGGPEWVRRFRALCSRRAPVVRDLSGDGGEPDDRVWVRNTEWLLDTAFERATGSVTLLVLWDGEAGDGEGGTRWMVDRARERDAGIVVLDTKAIFGPLQG